MGILQHRLPKRNRLLYVILFIAIIILGLLSRSNFLREFLPLETGDLLYACMCYVGVAFLFHQKPSWFIALSSLSFCFLIEFSQLIEANWLVAIRQNRFGALIFGKGFLWVDLLAYSLGVLLSLGIEYLFLNQYKNQKT